MAEENEGQPKGSEGDKPETAPPPPPPENVDSVRGTGDGTSKRVEGNPDTDAGSDGKGNGRDGASGE